MENVIDKLHFKGQGMVINAPAAIAKAFVRLGFKTALDKKGRNSNTIIFFNDKNELESFLKGSLPLIETDSVLWFAYPKGSSKIKTDINRDIVRVTAEDYGITTVTAVSLDDTWSGLRFRPRDKIGK